MKYSRFSRAVLSAALALIVALGASLACAEPPASGGDHRGPWDVAALSQPPAVEWLDQSGPVRRLRYEAEPFRDLKKTHVFAYFASPSTLAPAKDSGNLPAERGGQAKHTVARYPGIVLVHGGGGAAFRQWAELWARRGYAAIAMDLAGHGEKNRRLPDGGPDQSDDVKFALGGPERDQWTYHAVADVILAHSLLLSLPEVDPERTAVTGISWGGYLTCIVAGVDLRFKAAVPVYGCGYLHEDSYWQPRLAAMKPADRDRWVRLWDPSSYLGAAAMPMLFVNGTNDFAYPLDSYAKTYRLAQGPRNYRITVNMPHGHEQGWAPKEIGLFVDQYLKGGMPLPVVRRPSVEADRLSASVNAATELKSAALHYKSDEGPFQRRRWTDRPLTIKGNELRGAAPPPAARVWFVTVTDARGATVSSEIMFEKPERASP